MKQGSQSLVVSTTWNTLSSGVANPKEKEGRPEWALLTKLTEMPRPVSDTIITMRLPLSKDNFATIISVYAPTMTNADENKEAFYNQLVNVLSGIPCIDKLLLIGDFNARIGRDNDKWPLVMGKHGIGKCNSNGELLLALCSEFELTVTNTMFKQKDERKTTWMHPRSKHWHMIDFIITRCRDKMDIHSTRANCWTDHQMLRSKVTFRIRQKHNRQGTNKPTKLDTAKLSTISHSESFEQDMDSALAQWEEKENSTPDKEWAALQQVVYNTAKTYLGKPDRKNQDWFDPNATAFSPRVRHALTCTAEREPGASAYHRVQLPYASALKRDGNIVCVKQ